MMVRGVGLVTLTLLCLTSQAAGQTTRFGNTLRYGSGLIDVPVSSVIPHMAWVVSYSGFSASLDAPPRVDGAGDVVGSDPPFRSWLGDASLAVGLFDRLELGATLQDSGAGEREALLGAFGRAQLLRPESWGIGLAVGARYLRAPDGTTQPGRVGIFDPRLVEDYGPTKDPFETAFSPYLVATATLPGPDTNLLPSYDLTLSLGVGGGTFSEGADLPFYAAGNSDGWFVGSALHVDIGANRLLNLMGEYNGFEANAQVQVDVGGVRFGGFALGLNYGDAVSVYQSRKYGVSVSLALCPGGGSLLCRGTNDLIERPERDVMVLPAPPPDTVVLTLPETPDESRVTEEAIMRRLSPVMICGFEGAYGENRPWLFEASSLEALGTVFDRVEVAPPTPNCADLEPLGAREDVPLFGLRDQTGRPDAIYVPLGPDVWGEYRRR
ncbi:MAG: hypothetical protein ACR2QM_09840 [Longimicrobiales bacterium]